MLAARRGAAHDEGVVGLFSLSMMALWSAYSIPGVKSSCSKGHISVSVPQLGICAQTCGGTLKRDK